jgi:thiamine-monophosphate kinase
VNGHQRTGEFERIARYFAPLAAGHSGAFGLEDDAAVLRPGPGNEFVVTTDTLVAGVHYIGDEAPGSIARKLLRVNLSDLAAMGARPVAYTLNVALPHDIGDDWLAAFAGGLAADQKTYGITLVGGDSVATPGPATLTVAAYGEVAEGGALRRSGAGPGDAVYVSGTIGDGALGLKALRGELSGVDTAGIEALVERYRVPEPRIELGLRLQGIAHAAIDVSDGLIADLGHVAAASSVAVAIESAKVPLAPATAAALEADPGLLQLVLAGGDDYELVFTAAADAADEIAALSADLDLALTAIGRVEEGEGVRALDGTGGEIALEFTGWEHG